MAEKLDVFSPQEIVILEDNGDGWVKICTYRGGAWVYIADNLMYVHKPADLLCDEGNAEASITPQLVRVLERQGNRYRIETWLGGKWIIAEETVRPLGLPAVSVLGDLTGRIIILDAGHGLNNDNLYAGYSEQAAMLELAMYIKPLLEARGATVFMTRQTEDDVPLPVRAAMINKMFLEVIRGTYPGERGRIDGLLGIMQDIIDDFKEYAPVYFNFPYDWSYRTRIHTELEYIFRLQSCRYVREKFLFVSLHSNATRTPINTAVNGADVYIMGNTNYMNNAYYTDYSHLEHVRLFGEVLLDNIHETGIARRKVLVDDWFIIREHNLPAVLVENGFHTNAADRAKLTDGGYLRRLALAYEDAIIQYFHYIAGEDI
jgi:N-acetylmuramoyl-L-alanine amidase